MQVIEITLLLVSFRRFTVNCFVKFTVHIAFNGPSEDFCAKPVVMVNFIASYTACKEEMLLLCVVIVVV